MGSGTPFGLSYHMNSREMNEVYQSVLYIVLMVSLCPLFPPGENNILQIMVKVVRGVRPDLNVVPRSRPQACTGFLSLMQRCWAPLPDARPSFQGE